MSLFLRIKSAIQVQGGVVVLARCPACGRQATFDRLENVNDVSFTVQDLESVVTGQRVCPNQSCRALIFFVRAQNSGALIATYPAERLDFDTSNLPAPILSSMTEAVTCHANACYVAAAMLVRKTLEQICDDKGATGKDLKERIRALSSTALLPPELFQAMDELRLIGNDAAHVEAKLYDSIGKDEVEAGIDLAKEILKAVYQYAVLLAKLRALKKAPGGP